VVRAAAQRPEHIEREFRKRAERRGNNNWVARSAGARVIRSGAAESTFKNAGCARPINASF
jgi:hypothetical protein